MFLLLLFIGDDYLASVQETVEENNGDSVVENGNRNETIPSVPPRRRRPLVDSRETQRHIASRASWSGTTDDSDYYQIPNTRVHPETSNAHKSQNGHIKRKVRTSLAERRNEFRRDRNVSVPTTSTVSFSNRIYYDSQEDLNPEWPHESKPYSPSVTSVIVRFLWPILKLPTWRRTGTTWNGVKATTLPMSHSTENGTSSATRSMPSSPGNETCPSSAILTRRTETRDRGVVTVGKTRIIPSWFPCVWETNGHVFGRARSAPPPWVTWITTSTTASCRDSGKATANGRASLTPASCSRSIPRPRAESACPWCYPTIQGQCLTSSPSWKTRTTGEVSKINISGG